MYFEDLHNEYKKSRKNPPDDMWPTVSAFANTDGGTIHLGFTEDKTHYPSVFIPTGVINATEQIQMILDTANNHNKLSAPIIKESNIKIIEVDGKQTIDIYVPKAIFSDRPIYIKGNIKNTFWREGEADRLATETELKAILRNASPDDSSQVLDNFDISDINMHDLQIYKALYADANNQPEIASQNDLEFLKNHGLYRRDRKDGQYKMSRAMLLLFGKFNSIIDIYPSFMLDFVVKNKETDVDYLDRICTTLSPGDPDNIFGFFTAVMDKMRALVPDKFELTDGLFRSNRREIFLRAMREALINCLSHADYHSNLSIQILWFDDKVIFKNPGELLISKEEFFGKTDSYPRNNLIFQAFVQAKLGEHTGSGGYRILQSAKTLKLEEPELEITPRSTQLTIWRTGETEAMPQLPQNQRATYIALQDGPLSFKELAHLYSSDYKGHKILKEMIDQKLVKKLGNNRSTRYALIEKK